jgi:NAD(P)H-dependent flavin oxidoreductase YrpB (nitropropane dioxygenase family)
MCVNNEIHSTLHAGSRFVACTEASSHPDWKTTVVNAKVSYI